MGKKRTLKIGLLLSFFAGVSLAYFIWLFWRKLTELIGDSDTVMIILGVLIAIFLVTGVFSLDRITKKFM